MIEAANGYDAIELANEELPDIILMDISLPRISGLEAARFIKESPETEKVPGSAFENDRKSRDGRSSRRDRRH